MDNYEGTVLQSFLTVPIQFVWVFFIMWIFLIAGLIYLAVVI